MKREVFSVLLVATAVFSSTSAAQERNPNVVTPTELWSIDGSANPGGIPDLIAWRQFFGVLTKRGPNVLAENNRRRSYLKHYLGPGCVAPPPSTRPLTDDDIDRLLVLVDNLSPKVSALHAQAAIIKGNGQPSPQASAQLAELESQKNRLILDLAGTHEMALGADATARISAHVLNHVKSHTKIVSVAIPSSAHH